MFSSPGTLAPVSSDVLEHLNSNGSSFGVSGVVAVPHQMSVGWNSVNQLAAIWGLYAATFFVLDATASPACLVAATALQVAFGGLALHGPSPVGSRGSCVQHVPMGAMLSPAMLAAFMFLHTGFRSMTTGLGNVFEGLESAAFDATAWPAVTLPLVFDIAATVGPPAFVPGFFCDYPRCTFSWLCSQLVWQV